MGVIQVQFLLTSNLSGCGCVLVLTVLRMILNSGRFAALRKAAQPLCKHKRSSQITGDRLNA